MRERLAVVQEAPAEDADGVADAGVTVHAHLAAPLGGRLDERREALARGHVHDLDLLERQELGGAEEQGIETKTDRVGVRDRRALNDRPQQRAHHAMARRGMKMLSMSRVRPRRTAPATRRSRSKSAGAVNASGSTSTR